MVKFINTLTSCIIKSLIGLTLLSGSISFAQIIKTEPIQQVYKNSSKKETTKKPVLVLKYPGNIQTYFIDIGDIIINANSFRGKTRHESYSGIVQIGKIFSINGQVFFRSSDGKNRPLNIIHENHVSVAELQSTPQNQVSLTVGNTFYFNTNSLNTQDLKINLGQVNFDFVPLSVGVVFERNKKSRIYIQNSVGMSIQSIPYIQIRGIIKL